jgi:hypothetical protein
VLEQVEPHQQEREHPGPEAEPDLPVQHRVQVVEHQDLVEHRRQVVEADQEVETKMIYNEVKINV